MIGYQREVLWPPPEEKMGSNGIFFYSIRRMVKWLLMSPLISFIFNPLKLPVCSYSGIIHPLVQKWSSRPSFSRFSFDLSLYYCGYPYYVSDPLSFWISAYSILIYGCSFSWKPYSRPDLPALFYILNLYGFSLRSESSSLSDQIVWKNNVSKSWSMYKTCLVIWSGLCPL